jgi:hypothetical protein
LLFSISRTVEIWYSRATATTRWRTCKSVTTCATDALIQIKADQITAFSDGSALPRQMGRTFRIGIR